MAHIGDENGVQRIDKWLNISCLFKTRAQAAKACDARRVKVNGETTKPSKIIKRGDRITVRKRNGKFVNYTVLAVSEQNVSSKDARSLYDEEKVELSEEAKELARLHEQSYKIKRRKNKGRPTKKERREIEKAKKQIFGM